MRAKVIKNTIFYMAYPFIRSSMALITLPIMTRYLIPSDFGIFALLIMITGPLSNVLSFNVVSTSVRFFFKYKDNDKKLNQMYSTYLCLLLIVLAIGIIILFFIYPLLMKYLLKRDISIIWILLLYFQMVLSLINIMHQYYFQNKYNGKRWLINESIPFFSGTVLVLLLVVLTSFKFEAIIIGALFTEVLKSLFIFYKIEIKYTFKMKLTYLKELFHYSWPMVTNIFLDIGFRTLDKIILSLKSGIGQVGIYAKSNRIAYVIKSIMVGLDGSLTPFALNCLTENTPESKEKLANVFLKYITFFLFIALGIMIFTQEILYVLTTPAYYSIAYVVPILIYYHIFGLLGAVSYWLIRVSGKTYWTMPIAIIFFLSNLILNLILIPKYGVIGAALATAISAGITQIIQFFISLRALPIPMNIVKTSLLFSLTIASTLFLYLILYLKFSIIVAILIKSSILLLFAGVVLLLKITSIKEIKYFSYKLINLIKLKFKKA